MRLAAALLGATALATLAAPAFAQSAQTGTADEPEVVVVTGVRDATNIIDTSISVTAVSLTALNDAAPRTTAELFRQLPGVRSEASGGDGNANIAVRGLPVAAGGAKFLQLQEDGLPVMEFGDIAFGNADIFLRADDTVARVESVRGGSAATSASNSPGGIINFITKTGKEEGGSLAATFGLGYDWNRYDFNYGSQIGESGWYVNVGGFYRVGEGALSAGYDANKGGQIRLSVLREFERGSVRVWAKYLNDSAIGYLPMPVRVTGSNGDPDIGSFAGFETGRDTIHSPYFIQNAGLDGNNNRRVSDVRDGMHPNVSAVGGEFTFDLGGGWELANRFRYANTSGRFVSPFPAEVGSASAIAASIGGVGATLRYAAGGPNAGQAFVPGATLNGTPIIMRAHMFDTELNDLSNFANNLTLTRSFDVAGGSLDFTAGYYRSNQTIDMDWLWNSYLVEVRGEDARLLDVFNAAGQNLSQNGLYAYGVPFWGNCCQRSYNTEYSIDAPFVQVQFETGNWNFDGSVRRDSGEATGNYAGAVQAANFDVNGDGVIQPAEVSVSTINNAAPSPVNYDWSYTSYSLGANYRITDEMAAFGRISRGGRANADRLLFGKVRADGSVAKEDAVDLVDQIEGGLKYRSGPLRLYGTLFWAETEEQNFEATTQRFIDRTYRAFGLELEGAYRMGGFSVTGGLTWTDAEISKDALNPGVVGNRPRRQAELTWQATPQYRFEAIPLRVGASFIGTTDSYAGDSNLLVMPGFVQTNLFGEYELTEGLSLSLNVNNAFDVIGLTESEEDAISGTGESVIRARSIPGRTSSVTLRYAF
jgi:outer membrane receptor protein involved in Fe transport